MRAAVVSILVLVVVAVAVRVALRITERFESPTPHTQVSGLVVHVVRPDETGQGIGSPNAPHLALLNASGRSNGLLFVFLPGTYGEPACCQLLLQQAARLGFHVVGLEYPNRPSVASRCGNDLACYGRIRRNLFDGRDGAVAPANAVEHRLVALLRYLSSHHPDEGWSGYLASGRPAYARIVLGGHSQGGGEAAFIGKLRHLAGVVLLASPLDTDNSDPPHAAYWTSLPGLTPVAHSIGFDHTRDLFAEKIQAAWNALGLVRFGGPASVDRAAPPYGGSHELVSSARVRRGPLAGHDSVAVDDVTPRCPDGSARLAPVWRDMLLVAAGSTVTAGRPPCRS